MGSLMAGWQTKPVDAKEAFKRSTSSVTREEVQRFWRAKNETVEKQLRKTRTDVSPIFVPAWPVSDSGCEASSSHSGSNYWSPPITPTTPSTALAYEAASVTLSPGWWQKSYWAFLNEPPVLEDRQNRYVSQYDLRSPLMKVEHPSSTYPV